VNKDTFPAIFFFMFNKDLILKRLEEALNLALSNVREKNGGPFGCVIYKEGIKIAEGVNRVTSRKDPTAHAEVEAIRSACLTLDSWQLEGCEIYASSEPCPMCTAAILWARPKAVYFANSLQVAARFGFDDSHIAHQVAEPFQQRTIPFVCLTVPESEGPFTEWENNPSKIPY
jgi:guanine deaminase